MQQKEDNSFLWSQFCKLGEMMGDGLHYESDGKWISREYNRLAKILIPEIKETYKKQRKAKSSRIQEQMEELLKVKKCSCGGQLQQKRKGTKVCYCVDCGSKYIAKNKKNDN